jgi:hypothetical protein
LKVVIEIHSRYEVYVFSQTPASEKDKLAPGDLLSNQQSSNGLPVQTNTPLIEPIDQSKYFLIDYPDLQTFNNRRNILVSVNSTPKTISGLAYSILSSILDSVNSPPLIDQPFLP